MAKFTQTERKEYRKNVLATMKADIEKAKSMNISELGAINYVNKTSYKGGNALILGLYAYTVYGGCNQWLTFPQIRDLGGNVKGQKGIHVEKLLQTEIIDNDGNKSVKKGMKLITVFNIKQVQGIELKPLETVADSAKKAVKKTVKKAVKAVKTKTVKAVNTVKKAVKADTKKTNKEILADIKKTVKKPTEKKPVKTNQDILKEIQDIASYSYNYSYNGYEVLN